MRLPVRTIIFILASCAISLLGLGCGSEIGDSCESSVDCSPDGDRLCDLSESSPGGYCTVRGCDYDSCPDDAVCVRFYSTSFPDQTCDPAAEDISRDDCLPGDACTLRGTCAPRQSEVRFCMKRCSSGGDCRGDYECRNRELMIEHGGEPVLAPGRELGDNPPRFCAVAP